MVINPENLIYGIRATISSLLFFVLLPLVILTFILLKRNKERKLSKKQRVLILIVGVLLILFYPKELGYDLGTPNLFPSYREEYGCFGIKGKSCMNIPEAVCHSLCYGIPTGGKQCYILDSQDAINISKTETSCIQNSEIRGLIGPTTAGNVQVDKRFYGVEQECKQECERWTQNKCRDKAEIQDNSIMHAMCTFSVGISQTNRTEEESNFVPCSFSCN